MTTSIPLEEYGELMLGNVDLSRAIQIIAANALQASREFYQKSYFSLSASEKAAIDQLSFGMVAANYQAITPEFLAARTETSSPPVGFQGPMP